MFLCRGGRSAASSINLYYHSAASLQVATNLPQNAVWTLRNSSVISGSRVRDSGANNVYNVRLLSGMLQDESVKSNQCKYVPGSWTTCKSLSRLGFFFPFPWRSGDGNTKDLLSSPKSCFCLPTQTCFFHSSTNSVLSSASEQKQAKWTKREAAEEVVLPESSHGEAEKPEPEKKENKTKQLKKVFKEYGAVGVTFHIGISLISLGIFYVAVSSGVNMTAVLCKLGFSDSVVQSKMAAGTSTFVLAYAVHKLFAPFRISITLVSVPLIVRYLRKTGLFKSLPPHL